jgi:hypothetical protein
VLLAIDQGNTRTKFGVFRGQALLGTWALPTDKAVEVAALTRLLAGHLPIDSPPYPPIALCSSVPELLPTWRAAAEAAGRALTIFTGESPVPLRNGYATPATLGADRLLAAVAAAAVQGCASNDSGPVATPPGGTASGHATSVEKTPAPAVVPLPAAVAPTKTPGLPAAGVQPDPLRAAGSRRGVLLPFDSGTNRSAPAASLTQNFFGIPTDVARSIIFICDCSGSMTDSFDWVKYAVRRGINDLGEDQQFQVLFMSSGPPKEMPPKGLQPATDNNKELAGAFIDSIVPLGETDPAESLTRAFEMKPDVIFLLTDAMFDKSVVDLVKKLNADRTTAVNTLLLFYGDDGLEVGSSISIMKRIAAENGGVYKFISEADLGALAGQ